MKEFFCWTSYSLEASSKEEAAEKFIEAVKEKLADIVVEEQTE